jgi:hypothetical protein
VILLYRYERRLVSRPLGGTLLLLRLAVVGAVFVTLLEPVVDWTIDRSRTGRVVVSLDVSDSMTTVDRQADADELSCWARALGLLPGGTKRPSEDIASPPAARDLEPPEAAEPPGPMPPGPPATSPVAEAALQKTAFETVAGLTRKEIARRLIVEGEQSLQKRLAELAVVELQVFAGAAATASTESFNDAIAQPGEAVNPGASHLWNGTTPVAPAAGHAPLAGVVLFTDGLDNMAVDPTQLLSRMKTFPVPVYPVLMGSRHRPRDLAVGQLEYPEMLYRNDKGVLRAQLRVSGFENVPVEVTLEHLGRPDRSQTQSVTPVGRSVDVEFELEGDELGKQPYSLRIAPQADETRVDNNERRFAVNVIDDECRVLIVEGGPRWEFRFLDAALTRDEHILVDRVLFEQPYLGALPETFFPRTLPLPENAAGLPETPFAKYDAVVIGDVPEEKLGPAAWTLLDRFVRQEGGTLVLTAGKQHFPRAHRSPQVAALLPVENLRELEPNGPEGLAPPSIRGFHLQLTPEGARQQFLQFTGHALPASVQDGPAPEPVAPQDRLRIWDALPGHGWGLLGTARPAATILATLRDPQHPGGLEFDRAHALMAYHYVGAGQVLWIGIDSTWRWRHRVGDQYHHRFWGQLVRWAAEFRASAGNEHVRFGPDRAEIDHGDEVLFQARWSQHVLAQFPQLKARAEVYALGDAAAGGPGSAGASPRPGTGSPVRPPSVAPGGVPAGPADPVMTVDLVPSEERTTVFEGKAVGLPPGEYRVVLAVEQADLGAEPIAFELAVHAKLTTELAELTANRELLEEVASATGGRLFLPDEVHQIPDLFTDVTQHDTRRGEILLWNHWGVLAVCLMLLSLEWLLRKWNGLP